MPGGGKGGSSPAGNTTTTTINPTQQAQLPFLTGQAGAAIGNPNLGWNQAVNLATQGLQYYPGQTLANFNPAIGQGYDILKNTGLNNVGSSLPIAYGALNNGLTGGYSVQNSPAYAGLSAFSQGATDPQQSIGSDAGLLRGTADLSSRTPYAGYLENLVNGMGMGAIPYAQQMAGLGQIAGNNPLATDLYNYAYNGNSGTGTQIGTLAGYGAQAAANPYAQALYGSATADPSTVYGGMAMVRDAFNGAGAPNLATRTLGDTASGAYLNKNPYIDAQYNAAADPVTRQYMTATAPQADSNAEAAGRYGSGFHTNLVSQNEQNLGKTLGDLSTNIYGQDYANERGLQTQAQGTLGSLINQALGIQASAGQAIGNLGLGEWQTRQNALNQAGNQYLAGLNSGIGAAGTAGSLGLQDYLGRGGVLNNAASQYLGGIQTGIGALNNAGALTQNDFTLRGNLLNQAGNQYLAGLGQAGNQYAASGALNSNLVNSMMSGLTGLQGGYQAGNTSTLQGLALEPSVLNSGYGAANAVTQAGQGYTGLDQAQIQDAMNRFYGVQQAPWQTLTQYLNAVGQPTSGSSITQQPYFTNPTANALGGLTGGLGLINGVGSAFGSNGILGGLFGGAGAGIPAAGLTSGLLGAAPAGSMFGAVTAGADAGLFGDAAGILAPFLLA